MLPSYQLGIMTYRGTNNLITGTIFVSYSLVLVSFTGFVHMTVTQMRGLVWAQYNLHEWALPPVHRSGPTSRTFFQRKAKPPCPTSLNTLTKKAALLLPISSHHQQPWVMSIHRFNKVKRLRIPKSERKAKKEKKIAIL